MSPGVAMSMPVVRAGAKSITAPALVPVLVALHMSDTDALADAVLELRRCKPSRQPHDDALPLAEYAPRTDHPAWRTPT